VIAFAVAVVLIVAFFARERGARQPLLDPVAIWRRPASSADLAKLAIGFAMFISFTLTGARPQAFVGALLGVASYVALAFAHRDAAVLAFVTVPLGIGVGPCLGAISDLVLLSSRAEEAGGTLALNTLIQNVGSALGAQIAVAVVTGAGQGALGLPLSRGFSALPKLGDPEARAAVVWASVTRRSV
jgi:predicted MFS family arabinose efflux permease